MVASKGRGKRRGGLQNCGAKWYMGLLEERKWVIKIHCYGMHNVILMSLFSMKSWKGQVCVCVCVYHLLYQYTWLSIR